MKIEYKEDGRVIIELGPYEKDGAYDKSSTGASYMVDTTGGYTPVQGGPKGLKVDAKLILVIPKDQRDKK